jgi:membrane protease YdiL (CAAX protease family)
MPHQPQSTQQMPVLRFPFYLRRESDLSTLRTKQRLGFRLHAVCARFAGMVRETFTANPEFFLPVLLLFVWQITAIAVKLRTVGLALLMTLLLLVYGYRVLGKTPWLRRLGWVSPRQGFWFYSVLAGLASGTGVWLIARSFHESLGGVPPPHRVLLASASGPMLEEILFRGLFFWLVFELLSRLGIRKVAALSATVLLIAFGFAFSHTGRTGLSFYATILTGIAFGWMRAQSESTAAAALMHAVYNLLLSCIATF